MEIESKLSGIHKVNNEVPDNVCVHIYGIKAFPMFLDKISNLWTGIVTPNQDSKEPIDWIISYFKYELEGKPYYLIWFFDNNENHTITDEDKVIKEVKQFLEDEKELENEDSGNI